MIARKLLTLFCLLFAAGLSVRAAVAQPADALAAIKRLGGTVHSVGEQHEVEFHLGGRALTDQGLAHVAALENVTSLNLRDTKITGAGLVHLKGLAKLRRLHLERTAVGDEGIEHLAGLVNLEYLNLYGTKITDKSLAHLTGLKNLRRLYIWQTGVTDAGVAKLEKALPELKIVRGVDLSKLPDAPPEAAKSGSKPTTTLKWIATNDAAKPPKSQSGSNIEVVFENKSGRRVKLYWVSYAGPLKLYGTLDPGATRRQNSYTDNTWLITDEQDQPLGYFIIVEPEDCLAVIPKVK